MAKIFGWIRDRLRGVPVGYREIRDGEIFGPGESFKMCMKSGRNYVKIANKQLKEQSKQ